MKKKLLFAVAIVVGVLAMSCSHGRMYSTGTNAWNTGISSGVGSHYYSYSGPGY